MTTHTPQMLGLTGRNFFHGGLWNRSNMGEGMVIGILDDGISPGHRRSTRPACRRHPPSGRAGAT
jgi:hypothetical protein